jgi:hypothetical protein
MDQLPTLGPLESVAALGLCVVFTDVYEFEVAFFLRLFDRYGLYTVSWDISR